MRLFIALSVDTTPLKELRYEFKDVKGRFIEDSNFHMTLAFLGEVDECKIDLIKNIIEKIPFTLKEIESEEVTTFREDTVVVKFKNHPQLIKYQRELTKELDKNEIYFDKKPYKPHITIIRRSNEIISGEYNEIYKLTGIHLFSSKLTERGSIYKSLYKKTI